jgi:hypothetical protein
MVMVARQVYQNRDSEVESHDNDIQDLRMKRLHIATLYQTRQDGAPEEIISRQ